MHALQLHAVVASILGPGMTVQGVLCCAVQMVSRELEKECVVVFDEAHNIDNVCIEALSVNLRKQTLQAARNNIRKLHDVRGCLLWAANRAAYSAPGVCMLAKGVSTAGVWWEDVFRHTCHTPLS